MSQKIEIGVNANTSGAENSVKRVDEAAAGAAESFSEVTSEATKAGAAVDGLQKKTEGLAASTKKAAESTTSQVKYSVERLRQLSNLLEREIGQPVSVGDARRAALNFETDRARGRMRGRVVRDSSDFVEYLGVSGLAASNDPHRRRHRREVIASSMRGTAAAANGGLPPEEPPPGGGGEEGGDGFHRGVQRGQSMALAFGKSMLALAGINSIMGMASSAVDMATEESTGIDTLKRRTGDLGVSFDKLQDQVRAAGDGLGITYVESVRLAQQYAKLAGTFDARSLRTSQGFSRAFGLDPTEGVQFFGTMQRIKATGSDEQANRRLALMIGEAVTKSGYPAKADEIIAAVANMSDAMARATLSAPNVSDIAGYLTTLTKSGYPGLDPAGAAALLGAADNAVKRGGGMGESSQNFLYGALTRYSPGMNVVQANALWAQGLFGTTKNTFGKNTPLGDLARRDGLSVPSLDDVPNITKMMNLMQGQYGGNEWFMLDAIKNTFGLQNPQQAAALLAMHRAGPENLQESQQLLKDSHIDLSKLSASGIAGIGRVATAHDMRSLTPIYRDVMARGDVSANEKSVLSEAFNKGDIEALRRTLAGVLGTHEQEKTDGSETRQTIADLKNELTRVGGALLEVLNPIRTAVVAIAESVAPTEWKNARQREQDAGVNFMKTAQQRGYEPTAFAYRMGKVEKAYDAAGGGYDAAEKAAPYPRAAERGAPTYDMNAAMNRYARGIAGAQGVKVTDDQRRMIAETAGGDPQKAAFLEGLLRVENRGFGRPMDAKSPKGAQGYFQFMPSTWAGLGGGDIHDFGTNAKNAGKLYDELKKRYKGNLQAMAAAYNGGNVQGDRVAAGDLPSNAETQEYVNLMRMTGAYSKPAGGIIKTPMADVSAKDGGTKLPRDDGARLGETPIPEGRKVPSDDRDTNVKIGVTGEITVPVKDSAGNDTGAKAVLRPFVQQPAAGMGTVQ